MNNNNRLIYRLLLFILVIGVLSGCNKKDEILEAIDLTADEAKILVEAAAADFKTQQQSFSDARQAAKTGSPIVAGSVNSGKITANTWVYNSADSTYIGDIQKTNGSLHYICTFYSSQDKKQTQYNPLTTNYLKWKTNADWNFNYQVVVGAQSKFSYDADYTNTFTIQGLTTASDSITIDGETAVISSVIWKNSLDSVQVQSASVIAGSFKSIKYSKNLTNVWPSSGTLTYTVTLSVKKMNGQSSNKTINKSVTMKFNGTKTLTVDLENYHFSISLETGVVTKL